MYIPILDREGPREEEPPKASGIPGYPETSETPGVFGVSDVVLGTTI